ncbi:hypothetical protein AALO_G00252860 [Alosa alosa]|uniref:Peptidase C80 domain-containing protein n=1 Tax=Alosa alosa TaxID=278164 RepID=A0AAV6FP83_9TELE|nr:uncharacterized protein LOC125285626 [Alosa alosa]KAG5264355.1 hypothetical protein AALO_G00252860 [Alosa alosa]
MCNGLLRIWTTMKMQLFLSCSIWFFHYQLVLAGTVNLKTWTPDLALPAFLWPQPKDLRPSLPFGPSTTKPDGCERQESIDNFGFCVHTRSAPFQKSPGVQSDSTNNITLHNSMIFSEELSLMVNTTTEYDHQVILVLEPDKVVMEAAEFIFNKRPIESTLLSYHKGSLQTIRGPRVRPTERSHVMMVGHGVRGRDGTVQLGGHGPEEIAKLVANMDLQDGRIRLISLVGCYLGKEQQFAKHLLQALRVFGVETELLLYTSAVSVSPTGEQLTEEEGLWRHQDSSKRVFAKLDLRGNLLTRREGAGSRGQVVPNHQGPSLFMGYLDWPTAPQMFVPAELRKKYPYIDCLEGLTWSVFYEEHGKRRAPDYNPGNLEAVWLNSALALDTSTVTIKHITTILDLVCEIRFNAMEDENEDVHYVLNNYIYRFHRRTLRTALVGVFTNAKGMSRAQKFITAFEVQKESYTLQELRKGLVASEFVTFCRQTFQLRHCEHNCDLWGRYFMTAVFSASVRNFRTFSLFLVTTIACEVSRSQSSQDSICSAFVSDDYPMATREPRPALELRRRGFYGGTIADVDSSSNKEKLKWLDEVVAKENSLYKRSTALMSAVDHDQNTELDIFARVKVMNSYMFSSFMEFFRGTEEGRRLKRGCISPPNYDKTEES